MSIFMALICLHLSNIAFADEPSLALPANDVPSNPAQIVEPKVPAPIAPAQPTTQLKSPEPAPKEDAVEHPNAKQLLDQRLEKESKAKEEQDLRSNRELVTHEAASYHFELDLVLHDFPNENYSSIANSPSTGSSTGGALEFMYFPINHGIGRLGVGARVAGYKNTSATLSGAKFTFMTAGAKAIFEFQPFIAQVFIPSIVAGVDYVQFGAAITSGTNSFASPYYGAGLAIDLNALERAAASDALIDSGIRKVLLAYTFQQRVGSLNSQTGGAHFLGLRFEY